MKFHLLVVLLMTLASRLPGQVSVEVVMEQDQFLRDESVPLKVRITNLSGQTLRLGEDKSWLSFSVENRDGSVVAKLSEAPVEGEFTLDSAMRADRSVDLMPCYELSQPGRYSVSAVVRIKQWDREVASKARSFDIVRGSKIWEQEFGVPTADGEPEARKYALQLAPFFKDRKLYLRLTDPGENRAFKVFPLGSTVSFGRPEMLLDPKSNLHVLHQTGARSFAYNMINPSGDVLIRHTYDYTDTRPTLKSGNDGRVLVGGGQRRLTAGDIPRLSSTNDVREPKL